MPDPQIAWVFPGQGSQEVGMGGDLYAANAAARDLYDRADAALGRRLSALCFAGPATELSRTDNAQPAIYVTSLALLAAARDGGSVGDAPRFVAGHSLGEYTALAAADAYSFEDGLRLVAERGRLTQAAAEAAPGSMAAILGMDETPLGSVCQAAGAEICNINAPGQLIIGGGTEAVARACALALERGARRAVPLDVGGAFHTSLMQPAVTAMRDAVAGTPMAPPAVPLVLNDRATATTDVADIRAELVHQLTHPVRWVQCVEYMADQGVDQFVEIGPGKVLTGLIKRIARDAMTRNITSAQVTS
ncbi:MAG: ACP S-malonyltransferase [Chloroflexi bacterium]|nr:ACP S-malonyltransferase [Chloroflexota bacterium]